MKNAFVVLLVAAVVSVAGCIAPFSMSTDPSRAAMQGAAGEMVADARTAGAQGDLKRAIDILETLIASAPLFASLAPDVREQAKVDVVHFSALRMEKQVDLERIGDRAMADKDYSIAIMHYTDLMALGPNTVVDFKLKLAHKARVAEEAELNAAEAARRAREEAARAALAAKAAADKKAQAAAERAAKLAEMLNAARTAAAAGNWETVLEKADVCLKMEADQAEAAALKKQAELQLRPRLRLVVEADGREVPATVSDNRESWKAPVALELVTGRSCRWVVSYQSGWSDFAVTRRWKNAEVKLDVDWRGLKEQRVVLEEQKEPQPDEPLTLQLNDGVTLDLVWIPPGEFEMGANDSESDETPVLAVKITRGFGMGKYEVSQAQWQAVMGSNPSHFKGADLPVDNVSWNDCQLFLKRFNKLLAAGNMRLTASLPTEAEWEFACRSGTATKFYSGDDESSLNDVAWHWANSSGKTHPVGQKRPNRFGLYDMHGNVWEWCQDWFGNYSSGPASDPVGPTSGVDRVLRGGSFVNRPVSCRAARRCGYGPAVMYNITGLRVVVR